MIETRRKFHLILVDTRVSERYDLIVEKFKQKAASASEAERIVLKHRLRGRDLTGLELRTTDP